jgi:prepilin-type processing-associated H-X9-DG protein
MRLEYPASAGGDPYGCWFATIQPYTKNWQVQVCPDKETDWGLGWPQHDDAKNLIPQGIKGRSMSINEEMSGWNEGISIASYERPAELVQFADAAAIYDGNDPWDGQKTAYAKYQRNPDNPGLYKKVVQALQFKGPAIADVLTVRGGSEAGVPIARHNGTCNVIFYDGHAKAIKLSQFWLTNPADWYGPKDIWENRR